MDPQQMSPQVVLDAVAYDLGTVATYPDPILRARKAAELMATVQGLLATTLADVRRAAVAEAVAGTSAAAVAEQLSISRARVYALVDGRGAVGVTRPRQTR